MGSHPQTHGQSKQTNNPNNQNGDHQGKLPFPLALLWSSSSSFTSASTTSQCFVFYSPFNLLTSHSQNAAEYVQGGGAQASKEANKQVAKDGDASVGTRASAAKDAVSDKIDQSSHEGKADLHKEAAKH